MSTDVRGYALPAYQHWFVGLSGMGQRPLQLFGFPYSGGTGSCYAPWREQLVPEAGLVGIQLPGRADRLHEPLILTMHELLDSLLPQLRPRLNRPYVLYGHSNGALLAFAVLDRILREALPPPLGIVLSGKASPTCDSRRERWSLLPDDQIIHKVRSFGGTPEEVLCDPDLMCMVLPILRADFALGESFQLTTSHHAVAAVPALILAGREDHVPVAEVFAWTDLFSRSAVTASFDGGHFFINHGNAVVDCINGFLRRVAGSSDARRAGP
jgi:medium-chain acyl-[acyl-carrier-protein] hydrolase